MARHSSDNNAVYDTDADFDTDEFGARDTHSDASDHSEASDDSEMPTTRLGRALVEHIRLKRRYGRNEMGDYKYMVRSATDHHYTIYIGLSGARCTCPDGRRGNRCKHI